MNVIKLNEYLSGNVDAIETLLEHLECTNINYNAARCEFRCSREEGKNPSAVLINANTLRFKCFSTNEQGSIYNFVMNKKKLSFPAALRWVVERLNLDSKRFNLEVKLPFDGFFKTLIKNIEEPELSMKHLDLTLLDDYGLISTMSFLRDGISIETQEKFHLGYDCETDRITIPQWDMYGNLVGIMGRSNDPNVPYEYRWLPIIPCSRSYTLFGYHQNYARIQQQQLCIIVESEKGVMQLDTMGFPYGLATCTNSISKVQERYIKALQVDKTIIAYDEGIDEEMLRYEAEKVKVNNMIMSNSVGYIYDPKRKYLGIGSKNSPTDIGSDKFRRMINECVKWI